MKLIPRRTVLFMLLAVLFAAPGVLALLFFRHPTWLGAAPTNQGFLLSPPVQVAALADTSRNWRLLLWNQGGCDTACRTTLEQLAKVRLALGRRARRVDVLLLTPGTAEMPAALAQSLREADIHTASADENVFASLPPRARAPLFIASPAGYLVLSYAKDARPGAIYHDLKHLLETNPDG